MRKPKDVGRIIAIETIMLALFVAIMFVVVFNKWINGKVKDTKVDVAEQSLLEEIQKTNFYENGWDRKIVEEIAEGEVPIPSGFEFVSGTKATGLIIKDKATNAELMWIPYDENASVEGMEEYYKNVEYQEIDSETFDSIEKYGGFYVTLEEQNQYETLKQLDNNSYQTALAEAEKIYKNSSSVYGNLLSLTELQQVLAFANKNGIDVKQTSKIEGQSVYTDKLITVTGEIVKTEGVNKKLGVVSVKVKGFSDAEKQEIKYDKNYLSQIALVEVEGETRQVPIPNGYEYMTINELKQDKSQNKSIVKIRDDSNKNLVYVWVPVNAVESIDSLENAKIALNKLYEEYKVENNWQNASDPIETTEYKQMLASVMEYGGFYMSEAELGYDNEGKPYNKTRGMTNSLVNLGEYYRTVGKEQIKERITEKSGLEKNPEGGYTLTYEKAKEISESLSKKSTVSHLTYGAEWDAAMLWIMKTNSSSHLGDIVKDVIQTSAYMPGAKYKGQIKALENSNFTIETKNIQKINGMYGLAGNISDLTQESMEENGVTYRILRGGGFLTEGNETPMASRMRTDNIGYNDIGFRNCLYIKTTYNTSKNKAIINVPIDARPISRHSFANLVEAAGFDYIEINSSLDSFDGNNNYNVGDSEKIREQLADTLSRHNDKDTTVIINTSSYFFGGLIASRGTDSYNDIEFKIKELENLIKNNYNVKYYINLSIPRTIIDEEMEGKKYLEDGINISDDIIGENGADIAEKGLEYFYNKYKNKEDNSYRISTKMAIIQWQYIHYFKQEGNKVPVWADEFYYYLWDENGNLHPERNYKNVLSKQQKLYENTYNCLEKLIQIKNKYSSIDIKLIVNTDDCEIPYFLNAENNEDIKQIIKYDESNAIIKYSPQWNVLKNIETNHKNDCILLNGQDEVNYLILARELVGTTGNKIIYNIEEANKNAEHLKIIKEHVGDYETKNIEYIVDSYNYFINELASENAKLLNTEIYINSASQTGKINPNIAINNIKESINNEKCVAVIDLMQDNYIDKEYFLKLIERGYVSQIIYGGWNTIANSMGISMSQLAVYSILQSEAENAKIDNNRVEKMIKVMINNFLENGIYNINRQSIYKKNSFKEFKEYDILKKQVEKINWKIGNEEYNVNNLNINYSWPFNRYFEIKIDYDFNLSKIK